MASSALVVSAALLTNELAYQNLANNLTPFLKVLPPLHPPQTTHLRHHYLYHTSRLLYHHCHPHERYLLHFSTRSARSHPASLLLRLLQLQPPQPQPQPKHPNLIPTTTNRSDDQSGYVHSIIPSKPPTTHYSLLLPLQTPQNSSL